MTKHIEIIALKFKTNAIPIEIDTDIFGNYYFQNIYYVRKVL